MFADLDIVFFEGCLLGDVRVGWERSLIVEGAYGIVSHQIAGQCRISLDAEKIYLHNHLEPLTCGKVAWMTMLHEMCQ